VLAATHLHNTIEDTDTTIQDLMRVFGEEVAQLVYWLTDAEKGNLKARMAMASWRLGRASPWQAKLIKFADIIDNTRNIARNDPDFAPVLMREKRNVLNQMVLIEGDCLQSSTLPAGGGAGDDCECIRAPPRARGAPPLWRRLMPLTMASFNHALPRATSSLSRPYFAMTTPLPPNRGLSQTIRNKPSIGTLRRYREGGWRCAHHCKRYAFCS
jgi:hypothetical protein